MLQYLLSLINRDEPTIHAVTMGDALEQTMRANQPIESRPRDARLRGLLARYQPPLIRRDWSESVHCQGACHMLRYTSHLSVSAVYRFIECCEDHQFRW